jgi:hypothetical protein
MEGGTGEYPDQDRHGEDARHRNVVREVHSVLERLRTRNL